MYLRLILFHKGNVVFGGFGRKSDLENVQKPQEIRSQDSKPEPENCASSVCLTQVCHAGP